MITKNWHRFPKQTIFILLFGKRTDQEISLVGARELQQDFCPSLHYIHGMAEAWTGRLRETATDEQTSTKLRLLMMANWMEASKGLQRRPDLGPFLHNFFINDSEEDWKAMF